MKKPPQAETQSGGKLIGTLSVHHSQNGALDKKCKML